MVFYILLVPVIALAWRWPRVARISLLYFSILFSFIVFLQGMDNNYPVPAALWAFPVTALAMAQLIAMRQERHK
jgi:hypothetical protein